MSTKSKCLNKVSPEVASQLKTISSQLQERHLLNNPFKTQYYETGIAADPTHKSNYINLTPEDQTTFQKLVHRIITNLFLYRNLQQRGAANRQQTLCWNCVRPCKTSPQQSCLWHTYKLPLPEGEWLASPCVSADGIDSFCVHFCKNFSIINLNRANGWSLADLSTIAQSFFGTNPRTFLRNPDKYINLFNSLYPFMDVCLREDEEDWEESECTEEGLAKAQEAFA